MNNNSSSAGAAVANDAGLGTSDAADAAVVARMSDTRGPIRLGFWVLIVGFGLFLAWAALAPLDEGVSSQAVVSAEARRKTIQHMQGGMVRKLLVREGVEVKEGDTLIELDDALARASFESIRQNYLSQRAQEGRLLAELAGASAVTFHPDLMSANDPQALQHMAAQQQLFAARRAAQVAELAALQEGLTSNEFQVAGMKQVLMNRRAQQSLQTQQLGGLRALADEGFAPRNQALQLEQAQADLRASLSDLEASIQRLQSAGAEAKLRIAQRRQEYAKEASAGLADVRREVQANQERLVAVTQELDRMHIKAPIGGQIIGLAAGGTGSVVTPGQRLMDILPRGAATVLDVKIPPHVIDRVAVGNDVEVRFSAFAAKPHLVVLGKLVSVSGDVVNEMIGGMPSSHYVGRVELTPAGLKALGNETVQPGMTADVLVKSGERSLLTYLLHPLTKRVAASMTEQ